MHVLCLLSVLLTSATSHRHISSPQLLPLRKYLPLQRNTANVSELNTKSDIVLPHGQYHVSNFEMTSTTLNLNGKESTIFPSFVTDDEDLSEDSEWNGFWDSKEDRGNSLFLMSNCTTWMSSLRFECGSGGFSIAQIWDSCVGIVGSVLMSNRERGPFVIVGGDWGSRSSVTIISSSHTSSCFPWLLPLTSLDGCDCFTPHNSESSQLRTEVLVTGSDLEVCDACLIGGSGALFDFSGLPRTTTDRCSITTTLASTSFLNTTSSIESGSGSVDVDVKEGGCDFGDSESVYQKMIGSCVCRCTNHLCGTGFRDLNLGEPHTSTDGMLNCPTLGFPTVSSRIVRLPRRRPLAGVELFTSPVAPPSDSILSDFENVWLRQGMDTICASTLHQQLTSQQCPTAIPRQPPKRVESSHPLQWVMFCQLQLKPHQSSEIVVTLDKEVTGSLHVLISNSEGTGRTDTTKAPNIGRVLVFSIESSSIGGCTVSTGETGLLQLPLSDYKIVTASLSKYILSFSELSLEVTQRPTFTSANCVLDDSCTRAFLNLEGIDLDDETFDLTLQNGWTLEAIFTDKKATIDLGVIGESSKWIENEVFEITSGTKRSDDSIVVSVLSPLCFTIPLAARLMNIVVSDLNEANEVTLSFSYRLLKPDHDYTITLERNDGNKRVVMDVRTNSSGLLAEQTVKLSPSNRNEEEWKNSIGFGEEYVVTVFSAKTGDTDYPILFSPILVTMPNEPARISSAKCSTNSATTTIVSVEGSGLLTNETYTLTLSGTPTTDPNSLDVHNAAISVMASSSTEAKSIPLLLSSTSESSLLFGHTYTITAITNGSVAGIVVGTPSFTTRSTPTLTSLLCKLKEGDAKTAEISISGTDIPDGLYNLVVKKTVVDSTETELPIKIVDSAGKVEFVVFSSTTLEYGAEYKVVSLSSSSVTVVLPTDTTNRLMKVPDAPARVRSALCVLAGEKQSHVEVVVCGENLPIGNSLSVKVTEVGLSGNTIISEILLPEASITSTTSTDPVQIQLYGASNPCLEYGKTYELTSLTFSETVSFILDESVRFSVPLEPLRITSASSTTDETDWTVVSVEGSGFVLGEFYKVSVSGHPIGSLSPPPSSQHNTSFVVIGSSSKKATSSALQLHPAEGSQLKFSYSYKIVGIWNGTEDGVVDSVSFETQSDFPRHEALITRIEAVPTNSLNTSMVIEVSGSNLPSGTVGTLTLDTSFSFAFTFNPNGYTQIQKDR
ncbi:hypothetical protein BLNAU_6156 [Blattamonas nauphoetae]|uniref:Uncharacterized protein n=1 Tax=Blattamonas nauphoetae TaxID=2049346 RepID=A0ABQ9Y580_9EUKA|nr:hypothetical protein BLNAU_6156 [Blattamonas nauphoetae]